MSQFFQFQFPVSFDDWMHHSIIIVVLILSGVERKTGGSIMTQENCVIGRMLLPPPHSDPTYYCIPNWWVGVADWSQLCSTPPHIVYCAHPLIAQLIDSDIDQPQLFPNPSLA